ncbi:hypothetical protein DFO47_102452 [Arthrobacter sp. AG258]|nr:hypothetical protein DFO47_102452 [Arthrobacter sp. AG258]
MRPWTLVGDSSRGVIRWVINVAIILIGALVAFFRMPWEAQRSIWAEDGGVFLNDAISGSGWRGILAPYEGYLHLIPRLAANLVVSVVPINLYALAMNFLSCIVVSLVGLLVYRLSKPFFESRAVRVCLASIPVLVAPGPVETLANFANVHWFLLWLAPWLLLKPAKSRKEGIFLLVASLVVALTEILALMFVPLFLYRWRDKSKWYAAVGLVVGLACQIFVTLTNPRSPSSGYPVNAFSVFEGWFLNSSSALFFGDSATVTSRIHAFGPLPIVFAAFPFIMLLAYIMWKGSSAHRFLAGTMFVASIGTWAATQVVNPQPFFDYAAFNAADWNGFFISRYSTAPSMFLLALFPLASAVLLTNSRAKASLLIGSFLALQLVFFFPTVVSRTNGPVWSEEVNAGKQACSANPTFETSGIQIAPRGWFADKVHIGCKELLGQ